MHKCTQAGKLTALRIAAEVELTAQEASFGPLTGNPGTPELRRMSAWNDPWQDCQGPRAGLVGTVCLQEGRWKAAGRQGDT